MTITLKASLEYGNLPVKAIIIRMVKCGEHNAKKDINIEKYIKKALYFRNTLLKSVECFF